MPTKEKNLLISKLVKSSEELSEAHLGILNDVADVLKKPLHIELLSGSDIVPSAVGESLGLTLQLHHALNFEPLSKKSFEYAFCKAWQSVGSKAHLVEDSTYPGADITIDGRPFSLKTEAAKSISKKSITISKLMEARWIRECSTGEDFLRNVRGKVVSHLQRYSRIVMLRAFEGEEAVEYQVVEIPTEVILEIDKLNASSFSPRTKNGTSTAIVMIDNRKAFTMRLDGSVEKITIAGLSASLCILHGTYKILTSR